MPDTEQPGKEGQGAKKEPDKHQRASGLAGPVLSDVFSRIQTAEREAMRAAMAASALSSASVERRLFEANLFKGLSGYRGEREATLEQEISSLKTEVNKLQKALVEAGAKQETLAKLEKTVDELQAKQRLSFVLHRIHDRAGQVFLESQQFQQEFLQNRACQAYVMAVDLRRSTELMLKSRAPELFAVFITDLCGQLRDVVLEADGVFDKFTGDGILASFPDFYSGPDAGYKVISAAERCHAVFAEHYAKHRKSFHTVLKDVGLGIGIDFGETHLVVLGQELAIVGVPVVYACRMAGTAPGTTLLNQPAYEEIFEKFSAFCTLGEGQIDVKHEGTHLGYLAKPNGKSHKPLDPAWQRYSKPDAAKDN